MIKLQCTKCGKVWYTTYVQGEQICSDCNGTLVEVEMESVKKDVVEEEKPENDNKIVSFFKSLFRK